VSRPLPGRPCLNHGPCASLSTLRFLEAHAVPSDPLHGVGSNLDLIKANDAAQASERRPLDLFRCCDEPRPFGICIWAISVWWPWPRRVAAISFSRVELRSSSSV